MNWQNPSPSELGSRSSGATPQKSKGEVEYTTTTTTTTTTTACAEGGSDGVPRCFGQLRMQEVSPQGGLRLRVRDENERERETPRCERYADDVSSLFLVAARRESEDTLMSSARHLTSSPSEYFVLGFKDRNLEAEYWNDVTLTSKYRILLGWFVSTLLFFVGKSGSRRLIISPGGACSYWSPSESIGADSLF